MSDSSAPVHTTALKNIRFVEKEITKSSYVLEFTYVFIIRRDLNWDSDRKTDKLHKI